MKGGVEGEGGMVRGGREGEGKRKNEVTRRRMKSVQVSEAPQVSATCAIALSGARRGKRGGQVITSDGDPSNTYR